ncbi:unnamed protein product [Dracunculus medinensis]|uniref:Apple domain-containing protein n=1 Tax=Dracunculus medinensis TaxID=318479 RepID=A0A0N4U5D8_DRAME|nr:unnamed protein product [Dracunculus medinensis]
MLCCIACAKDSCCIGYTYNNSLKRCFMKSTLSYSEVNHHAISGLKANINSGQAAFLKNIKIEGGAAANVRLRKPEECQQYCTAYGIYSWFPADYSDESDDGHCTCMTRIRSLEYSYGAQSAVFPSLSSMD